MAQVFGSGVNIEAAFPAGFMDEEKLRKQNRGMAIPMLTEAITRAA